jgi:hypothetical protein
MDRSAFRVLNVQFISSLSIWLMEIELLQGEIEPGQVFVESAAASRSVRIMSVALGDQKKAGGRTFTVHVGPGTDKWIGELAGSVLRRSP